MYKWSACWLSTDVRSNVHKDIDGFSFSVEANSSLPSQHVGSSIIMAVWQPEAKSGDTIQDFIKKLVECIENDEI